MLIDVTEYEKPKTRTRRASKAEKVPKQKKLKAPPKIGCEFCKLKDGCYFPKMEPWGKGELGIAIVVNGISDSEDANNELFSDRAGQILQTEFSKAGIDLYKDCTVFPMVQCFKNGKLVQKDYNNCNARFEKQLQDFQPEIIIAFGDDVIKQLFKESSIGVSQITTHGTLIPFDKFNSDVLCSFDVQSFMVDINDPKKKYKKEDFSLITKTAFNIIPNMKEPFKSKKLDESKYTLLTNINDVIDFFEKLLLYKKPTSFDYETTGVDAFALDFKILTAAFSVNELDGVCIPIQHPEKVWKKEELKLILDYLAQWCECDNPKIIQNWAFEDLVSRQVLGVPVNNCVSDTMILQHLIDNRNNITAQKFQCFVRYGTNYDKDIDQENLKNTPLDVVAKYNVLDARYCFKWEEDLRKELPESLKYAEDLFMDALPTFTEMKIRGIKVDVDKLNILTTEVDEEIKELELIGENASFLKEYKNKFGEDFMESSPKRKQKLYFDLLGLKPLKETKTGYSTDAETMVSLLQQVERNSDIGKFIRRGLDLKKLEKLKGTYIHQIQTLKDVSDYLHPGFLLHRATTYRSSSAAPNFQNLPVRDEVISRVRTVLVPRFDYFLNIDYSANEFKYIATISGDKMLISDINNGMDPHRYFASKLYEKPESQINEEERYAGKNGFVFPLCYGSYHKSIANKNPQWKARVVEQVELIFKNRYKQLIQWQLDTKDEYARKGYIESPLGFRFTWGTSGIMSFNNICNSNSQGTAFHRLLWAIPRINREFNNKKLNSLVIGQIHDSLVIDLDYDELPVVKEIVDFYMLENNDKEWDWDHLVVKEIKYEKALNLLEFESL